MDCILKPCTTTSTTLWGVQNHSFSALVDRLTSLPDELLIRILSLLPTKDAAAMSVLATRMRRVFPWITSLNFDGSPISHCLKHPYAVERFPTFVTFVDTVLQAYKSQSLTRFRLRIGSIDFANLYFYGCTGRQCSPGCLPDLKFTRLNAWISFPLTLCGLRELDLCILVRKPGDSQLPPAIFTCETLEVLKLEFNLGLDEVSTTPSYRLPNLKLLLLRASFISDDGFLPRLVSSCPLLEDLTFEAFTNHAHHTTIYSTSLRRLSLIMHKLEPIPLDNTELVLINTPNLEDLVYVDNLAYKYSIPIMPCLVKAEIEIFAILQQEEVEVSSQQLLSLIRPLSYVRHLSLLGRFMREFHRVEETVLKNQLPVFPNLNHLELDCPGENYYWNKFLLPLLICSPVLETLIFSEGLIEYFGPEFCVYSGEPLELEREFFRTAHAIPPCCRYHLKKIVIKGYFGVEQEVEMVQFLLSHALVLEELVICRPQETLYPVPDDMSVENTLKNLPRASVTCSIQVL